MRGWKTLAGVLGAAGLVACAHESTEAPSPVAINQQQTENAQKQAAEAQRQASDAQAKADRDRAEVERLKAQLAQAQSQQQLSGQQAQELQRKAFDQNEQAQARVSQGQQAALMNQQSLNAGASQATSTAMGTVSQSDAEHLVISRAGMEPLQLRVNENTVVTLDGQSASPANLPEGVSVRASFRPGPDLPIAVKIEAGANAPQPH